MNKTEKAKKRLEAANLRILATSQRANAEAHRRQAEKPIYAGQEIICLQKADQLDAFAERSEAQAALLEAEAAETNKN
jgi:hypothetical protein